MIIAYEFYFNTASDSIVIEKEVLILNEKN